MRTRRGRHQEQRNIPASPGEHISDASRQISIHNSYRKVTVWDVQRVTEASPRSDGLPMSYDVSNAGSDSVHVFAKHGLQEIYLSGYVPLGVCEIAP